MNGTVDISRSKIGSATSAPPNTSVSEHYSSHCGALNSSQLQQVQQSSGLLAGANVGVIIANSSPSPELQQQICAICGDRATGKHYGSFSCDGCKGFFRRSVRKRHQYSCRFNRCCPIDKDKRNTCRFCRLEKCYRAGMKKEAVQNERDKISVRRSSFDDYTNNNDLTIARLVDAETRTNNMNSQDLMSMVQNRHAAADMLAEVFPMVPGHQQAGVNDVCSSMRVQLLTLVEWAKSLTVFTQLQVNEQIALLRAHAGEMLILGVVWRTVRYAGSADTLVLGNHQVITRQNVEFHSVASRILDELVVPFKELDIEETEYVILKAIVFFDQDAPDLQHERQNIRNWRHQIQLQLMDHMNDRQYTTRGRFGSLLLLLPKLQSIAHLMIQEVHAARIYNKVVIDKLLQELLLAGEKDQPHIPVPVGNTPAHFPPQIVPVAVADSFCGGASDYQLNGASTTSPLAVPLSATEPQHQHQQFVFTDQHPTFYHQLSGHQSRGSVSQPASPISYQLSSAPAAAAPQIQQVTGKFPKQELL